MEKSKTFNNCITFECTLSAKLSDLLLTLLGTVDSVKYKINNLQNLQITWNLDLKGTLINIRIS